MFLVPHCNSEIAESPSLSLALPGCFIQTYCCHLENLRAVTGFLSSCSTNTVFLLIEILTTCHSTFDTKIWIKCSKLMCSPRPGYLLDCFRSRLLLKRRPLDLSFSSKHKCPNLINTMKMRFLNVYLY